MNVDFDDDYYKNNVNCDQHVTLHLDNIQTINEDSNNEAKIGMLNLIPSISNVINSNLSQVNEMYFYLNVMGSLYQ